MALYKAKSISLIKNYLHEHALEDAFFGRLRPELKPVFEKALPVDWLPIEQVTEMISTFAPLAFPDDDHPLETFGRMFVRHDTKGVYKFVLKNTNLPFLLSVVPRLWKFAHKQGLAHVKLTKPGEALVTIRDYPDLPPDFKKMLQGYLLGGFQLSRGVNIRVGLIDQDPNALMYPVTWDT